MFYNTLFFSTLKKKCVFFEKKWQKYLVGKNKEHIFAPALEK